MNRPGQGSRNIGTHVTGNDSVDILNKQPSVKGPAESFMTHLALSDVLAEGGTIWPTWTTEDLDRIGRTEELELASLPTDGTLRPVRDHVVVRAGEELYVRSAARLNRLLRGK
jgi:hypothetical protein